MFWRLLNLGLGRPWYKSHFEKTLMNNNSFKYIVLKLFKDIGSSIRNGGISTFFSQKIALKKSMKFTCFIVPLLLKSHKTCKVYWFLSTIFCAQNVLISPFLILPTSNKTFLPSFTIIHNFLPIFILLLPLFATFYYIL